MNESSLNPELSEFLSSIKVGIDSLTKGQDRLNNRVEELEKFNSSKAEFVDQNSVDHAQQGRRQLHLYQNQPTATSILEDTEAEGQKSDLPTARHLTSPVGQDLHPEEGDVGPRLTSAADIQSTNQ
ncbi:hypothetical protein SNE40_001566 [Patella caerulea]|uniref:Uncharacterized protein n=1 Tax=Patella caerulea TaxID=87958 RepID=A0AAN8QI61_PATCE